MEYLVIPLILGLLPGAIARARGLDFVTWWIYGAFLFPVALIHALFATPKSVRVVGAPAAPQSPKTTSERPPMTRDEMRKLFHGR
jgi:hypothetical protein